MFLYMFNVMVIVLEFIRLLGQIGIAFFHRLVHAFKLKPKKSVAGKVVLITGAAQGLGSELALRFAKLGATLVLWDINKVRKRARFDGTTYQNVLPDYAGLSKEQFRAAVLKERRLEFVAEGQRWFDLVRTGTLETLVPIAKPGVVPQQKHYLFPIPQRERDLNENLTQNPGY